VQALSILEDQITTLQYASDGRKDDPEEVVDALTDLYKRLGEFDVMYGLWCRQSAVPDSKVCSLSLALSLSLAFSLYLHHTQKKTFPFLLFKSLSV